MRLLFIFLFSVLSTSIYAQVDSEEKSVAIPVIESDEGEIEQEVETESQPLENTGLINPQEDKVNGLSVPKKNQPLDLPKKEFSMFETEEFGNPAELYAKDLKKHTAYKDKVIEKGGYGGDTVDQFLGDFTTKSPTVTIVYRDYGQFDGDYIRIFIDGEILKPRILLSGSYNGFTLALKEGINKIDFYALNVGSMAPNTAEFQILEEDSEIISANQWSLAAGVKATIVIIKE
ncbi:hypothetical protein ACFS5M_07545 [Lacinutrix iliipiscaria]|uniref:Secreted protein n=1 Tax=Lacinutrix iliipiscaria TaxID=1230532 RepID=A0ABW5WLF8_9FLAO